MSRSIYNTILWTGLCHALNADSLLLLLLLLLLIIIIIKFFLVVGCWENKKDQHRTVEWTVNAEVDSPSSGGDDVK